MRLLLDTHVLLWVLADPDRLPPRVAEAVTDPAQEVYVSAVAMWEIGIKLARGRLDADLDQIVRSVSDAGFQELPVTIAHTVGLRELPNHHGDPFDRLLVAQALHEGLVLVTADPVVRSYPVPTLWR